MISVSDGVKQVLQQLQPLAPRQVPLAASIQHVLAEPVASDIDSPPHDKSLVDGFAVRSADLAGGPTELQVLEEITAGELPTVAIGPGQCSRIMTGAPIPEGADAVVMIERTRFAGSDRVHIDDERLAPGHSVMTRGASLVVGQTVVNRGTIIRPIEIGLLAEVGSREVTVYPFPQVAVVSTGNELVPHDQIPPAGRIRNSNGPMLEALVASTGSPSTNLGIAPDDREALRSAIVAGLARDVLVLSGGVSAGVLDLVPGLLQELGVDQVFHKVDLKPGKPIWYGVHSATGRPVFGLPGNPVSTLVCFELFVRPAIRRLAGDPVPVTATRSASLEMDFDQRGDRVTYYPARLKRGEAGDTVRPVRWIGSADQRSVAEANALAIFPAGDRHYPQGDSIDVLPLN